MPGFIPSPSLDDELKTIDLPSTRLLRRKKINALIRRAALFILLLFIFLFLYSKANKVLEPPFVSLRNIHPDFIGREKILKELQKEFIPHRLSWRFQSPNKIKVLWGIGGIGKSELAIKFANDHLNDFSLIWTFNCDTEEQLVAGYRELAETLKLNLNQDLMPSVLKRKVHAHLQQLKSKKPWLLIFDNAVQELTDDDFPQRGGCILVTARESQVRRNKNEHLKILSFNNLEASNLLKKITGEPESKEMSDLASTFSHFPLALNQVAHYIRETPTSTIAKYLNEYHLIHDKIQAPMSIGGRYKYTLQNVWHMTFERLKQEAPEVIEWLGICSYLAPDNIPIEWIESVIPGLGKTEKVLRYMERFALMSYDKKNETISLHRLIKQVLQSYQQHPKENYLKAAQLIKEKAKFNRLDPQTWEIGKKWFPHAKNFIQHPLHEDLLSYHDQQIIYHDLALYSFLNSEYRKFLKYSDLFEKKSPVIAKNQDLEIEMAILKINCLYCISQHDEAITYSNRFLKTHRLALNSKPLLYANLLESLGRLWERIGKNQEAINCYQENIDILSKYGSDYQETIGAILIKQGFSYFRLGQDVHAERVMQKGIEILKNTCEENSIVLAGAYVRFGALLGYIGKLEEAMSILNASETIWESFYPDGHHEMGLVYLNKTECLRLMGNYQAAIAYANKALDTEERYVGAHSRYFAFSLSNLALCLQNLKKFHEALNYHHESLEMLIKLYGEKNMDVGRVLRRFGSCLREQGNYQEALSYQQKALEILAEVLPKQHPLIASIYKEIGICMLHLKRTEEALVYTQQAFDLWKNQYGKEHPQLAKTLRNMGMIYWELNDKKQALSCYEHATNIAARVYNKNHPHLINYFETLIIALEQTEEPLAKLQVKERIYPHFLKTLGKKHSLTRQLNKISH